MRARSKKLILGDDNRCISCRARTGKENYCDAAISHSVIARPLFSPYVIARPRSGRGNLIKWSWQSHKKAIMRLLRPRFAPARNDECVCHCERPKGAWQSHKKTKTRLLRRFAPCNDTGGTMRNCFGSQ